MLKQHRWPPEAWVPFAAGLVWLWYAYNFGPVGFLFAIIPGCMLLSAGFSTLLYPGDKRISQFIALGGVLGVVLALPALVLASVVTGLLLILLSAASFVCAGAISLRQEPHVDEAPTAEPSVRLAAEIAIDEAQLGIIGLSTPIFVDRDHGKIRQEVHAARELFQDRGWLEQPRGYHLDPPDLASPTVRKCRAGSVDYEHLAFDSGYEPHPEEPGRARWLDIVPNRTGHARVLRHRDPSRSWLVCIHGYGMGWTAIDFWLLRVLRFHQQLGFNVIMPILPLHGPRRAGHWHGQGFMSGEMLDTVHAEAQAVWDMRRLLGWVRGQGATRIGVYGFSLGGYNAALLACFEQDLRCVIPGVPATDFTRLKWRHGPPLHVRYAEHHGVVHDEVSEVLRVVSPLALEPVVPEQRRFIFGATADMLVPPDQVRDLWRHWNRPRILWYQGSHLSINLHPAVAAFINDAFRQSGLLPAATENVLPAISK